MPVGFEIGNHRMFIVDVTLSSMVGNYPPRIVRPTSQRLNTRIEGCAETYAVILEKSSSNTSCSRSFDWHTKTLMIRFCFLRG